VRRAVLLLLAALVLALPGRAQAQTGPACRVAAEAARDVLPAVYSWGGQHPDDPINPFTGTYWPRTGPDSFDCSGLVYWAYQQAGIDIGSSTHTQRYTGDYVPCDLDDLGGSSTTCWAPGDLAFAQSSSGQHVSIYVGEGVFADCYNHQQDCVLHDISQDSYYQSHFWQARRPASGCESLTVDPGTPSPFDPDQPRTLEAISGIVGPVQLVAPYECSECNGGAENVLQPLPEEEITLLRIEHWSDLGLHIDWLAVVLWNRVTLPIICWLLVVLQALLNAYSTMLNTWGAAINDLWRLLVSWLLWMMSAYTGLWAGVESLRDITWELVAQLVQFEQYWLATLRALQALIDLVASLTWTYVEMAYTPIAAMRYMVALLVESVPGMTAVIQDPESYIPDQLAGIEGNMFYQMFVGSIDGFADSVGWWWTLFIAFYYTMFIWRTVEEAKELN
jgi:hypothetical protein